MIPDDTNLENRISKLEDFFLALLLGQTYEPEILYEYDKYLRHYSKKKKEDGLSEMLHALIRSMPNQTNFYEIKKRYDELSYYYREEVTLLQRKYDRLLIEVEDQKKTESDIYRKIGDLETRNNKYSEIQRDFQAYLVAKSIGLNPDNIPLRRYIPIRVYLAEDQEEAIEKISKALHSLHNSLGFTITDEFPEERSSFFKKWFGKTSSEEIQEIVEDKLRKAARGIELATIGKYQSEIDKNQAEAVSLLLKSLENSTNAACQIGSILVIKTTDSNGSSNIFTRTLTQNELLIIEKNQNLLKEPQNILNELNRKCAEIDSTELKEISESSFDESSRIQNIPLLRDDTN